MTTRRKAELENESSGSSRPSGEFTPADRLCAWMTEGRRCGMLGDGSPYIGDNATRYCAWHHLLLESPQWSDSFDEFERYVLNGRGRYCGQWTHYPVSYLWDTVRGLSTYVGLKPIWCGRMDCRHFDIREIQQMAKEKPIAAPPSRQDGRALATATAGRLGIPAHLPKPVEQQKAELQDWVRKHEDKQDREPPF